MSANSSNSSLVSNPSVSTFLNACPCGSGIGVDSCCLPIIGGRKEPLTAEELLRARYTAFARGEIDYIISSHHSRTRAEIKRDEVEDWSKNSKWLGLHIRQTEGGSPQDNEGVIIFCAQYEADGETQEHWERALFEKEDGKWKFLDAQGIQTGTYKRPEPKIGRNDPCPCGSGKKFKKCCAVA